MIDALRARCKAVEADYACLERRAALLEQSADTDRGVVETLEGVLDLARQDRKIKTSLTLKQLELK